MTKIYSQAFTEAYEILSYLDEDNYKKIPNDIIDVLYENGDRDYEFFIDDSLPLYKQDLLEETKALLFNLYRDFLADSETREKVREYQRAEDFELERIKKEKFIYNDLFRKNQEKKIKGDNTSTEKENTSLIKYKKRSNIFAKLINKIKKYFSFN